MGVVKSSFFRLFAGGFAAGVVVMLALQPAEASRSFGALAPAPVVQQR